MMNTNQLDKLDLNAFGVQEMSGKEIKSIVGGCILMGIATLISATAALIAVLKK